MVNVNKGLLVKCSDPAIKQYLKHIDETNGLGRKFILQDLDDLHVFVAADVAQQLQRKLDELMEKNSYNPLESEQAQKARNR